MPRRLIVFTRYPEPGTTKTRLIPALGSEGAARLQHDLTRRVLARARELRELAGVEIEVRFEGGDAEKMTATFGRDLSCVPQGPGDLGCRMERAFEESFADGVGEAVLIGADCPDVTAELLRNAFQQLADHDLVLGPAADGGYYLAGLRSSEPSLFEGIVWGSDGVFEATMCRARERSLRVGLLETLSDIDRPEDLAAWQENLQRQKATGAGKGRLSVVIPTLNEAAYLPDTLQSLAGARDVEIIVVDGGSDDGTPQIARRAGCRVLRAVRDRAFQLNTGADVAEGSFLLFLHADTRLPAGFDTAIRSALAEPGVAGGAFRLRIDAPGWPLRLIERAVALRSRLFQMPYGDQGIFVRRETFRQIGGFPDLPIMDDFELIRRLRQQGKVKVLSLPATTSGRRWRELGPWRTTWINQKVILGYYLGMSPERLATWYNAHKNVAPDFGGDGQSVRRTCH